MSKPVPISVLLVEDDPLARRDLRRILGTEPGLRVVGEAEDGDEAVEKSASLDPDVVLMDLHMLGVNGIEATRRLTRRDPKRPQVFAMTALKYNRLVYEALEAGAASFMLKRDIDPAGLVRAIRVAASGEALVNRAETRDLVRYFNTDVKRDEDWASRVADLTERQTEVLRCIGKGHDNREIEAELHLHRETVKSHVSSLYKRLEIKGRAQAVIAAYESGLIVAGRDPASGDGLLGL